MRRREFIVAFGGATAVWLKAARGWAQEPGHIYQLGALYSSPRDAPHHLALRDELRRVGFIEGQNLNIDERGFGLRGAQFDEHATELVKARADVIMAGGHAAIRAAQQATSEIPILALTDNMIAEGFVQSLAKPGGNITGVTIFGSELDGKRQEIFIQALPGVHRIAALADRNTSTAPQLKALQDAARAAGVELSIHSVVMAGDIAAAMDGVRAAGAQAINVLASPLLFNNGASIMSRVAMLRLPAIYQWPEMADQGGFIGYGPSIVQLYRDVQSRQLVRLLRGTKPSELPVEQPTKFQLVINLKTAKALGLTVPQSILTRADEVIE